MRPGNSNKISAAKAKVLTVGIAVADHVFQLDELPKTAEKHFADECYDLAGGIAVNAALAIQALGGQASLLSRFGGDPAGDLLRQTLARSGVDLTLVETRQDLKSASSAVILDSAGERMIVNHRSGALFSDQPAIDSHSLNAMDAVLGDMRWIEATEVVFQCAKEIAKPTILDFDLTNTDVPQSILGSSDYIVFGEAALKRFARRVDVVSALKSTNDMVPSALIAVTTGENGVHFINRDGKLLHIPSRSVDVVSTLGAGDVFHGAFALAIAEGQSFERGLRFANDVAALKVSTSSHQSTFPTRSEVDAFQRSFS